MPGRGDEAFQAVWSPAGSRIAIIWRSVLPPMDLAVGYMSCDHVAHRWVSSQAVTCAQKIFRMVEVTYLAALTD